MKASMPSWTPLPRPTRLARRRLLLWPLAAWAASAPGAAGAARQPRLGTVVTPFDYARMINAAGRQRMLTQRVVKAYCQLALGVAPDVSRRQLDEALRLFDAQQGELLEDAPTAAVRRAVVRVGGLWAPFRRLAEAPVSAEGARVLAQRSEALLEAAHAAVLALQQAAQSPHARLVNLAGRQRMLSQRLAKLYMLDALAQASDDDRGLMDAARNEFTGALAALRAAPENTDPINTELTAVESHWAWFSSAIGLRGGAAYALVVAESSEAILDSMDLVTALYAGLAPR